MACLPDGKQRILLCVLGGAGYQAGHDAVARDSLETGLLRRRKKKTSSVSFPPRQYASERGVSQCRGGGLPVALAFVSYMPLCSALIMRV